MEVDPPVAGGGDDGEVTPAAAGAASSAAATGDAAIAAEHWGNHNAEPYQPAPVLPPASAEAATATRTGLAEPVSADEVEHAHWPALEAAVLGVFRQAPGELVPFSHESISRSVFKCVSHGHGQLVYERLMGTVAACFDSMAQSILELRGGSSAALIDRLLYVHRQYLQGATATVNVFEHLNRSYVRRILQSSLAEDVKILFAKHVIEHGRVLPLLVTALREAVDVPFSVDPAALRATVDILHSMSSAYISICPELFVRFLPTTPDLTDESEVQARIAGAQEAALATEHAWHSKNAQADLEREEAVRGRRVPERAKRRNDEVLAESDDSAMRES